MDSPVPLRKPAADLPAGDLLTGLPRSGIRNALRRAAAESPPAAHARPDGGLRVEETFFPRSTDGLPADLFGPGFDGAMDDAEPPVFFDIETCGLAHEPIFLIGCLRGEPRGLRFTSFFARDPSEEPALLRRAVVLLGSAAVWVSFNGRSFDAPRLRRRASLHSVEMPEPREHRDLLLAVRRCWRASLPNCRLTTVEERLLGFHPRVGDVPGREVPERYRDYVRTGDPSWVRPVLEHNRRDVAAMVVLHRRLWREGAFPAS